MKAKPYNRGARNFGLAYTPCDPKDATHIELNMPGPMGGPIMLPVLPPGQTRDGTPCWTWNLSTDAPTLKPSLLSNNGRGICHSFVTDGRVQFLGDCTHEMKGKTADLLDVDP